MKFFNMSLILILSCDMVESCIAMPDKYQNNSGKPIVTTEASVQPVGEPSCPSTEPSYQPNTDQSDEMTELTIGYAEMWVFLRFLEHISNSIRIIASQQYIYLGIELQELLLQILTGTSSLT